MKCMSVNPINTHPVTIASSVTAQIIKHFDSNIDVRASANMRIDTIQGIQYVEHLFVLKERTIATLERFLVCQSICKPSEKH